MIYTTGYSRKPVIYDPARVSPEVRQCNRPLDSSGRDLNARAFACTFKYITERTGGGGGREGRQKHGEIDDLYCREVMDSGRGYVAHETLIEESRRKLHALRSGDALIECIIYRRCAPACL